MRVNNFPHYKQRDHKDCGPTCLKIIAKHYNKTIHLEQLRELSETSRVGSSLLGLSEAAENLGFRSLGIKVSLNRLLHTPLPCILHWNKNHYVVLYTIKKDVFYISDPAHGLLKYTKDDISAVAKDILATNPDIICLQEVGIKENWTNKKEVGKKMADALWSATIVDRK